MSDLEKELEMPEASSSDLEYVPDESVFEEGNDYEDLSPLEDVPGYSFYDPEWEEVIDESESELNESAYLLSYDDPESVCGRDDRVKIGNTTTAPYKFICKLYIKPANSSRYTSIASGFFIGPKCIITSGHVVHSRSGWAKEIKVSPGQNGSRAPFGTQTSKDFYSVKGWTRNKKRDYDHGAIILPNRTLYNRVRGFFGYGQQNGNPLLNNSGYPGDKRPSTHQWYNAGRVTRNSGRMFEYMIDTYGGQSGSPVWTGSKLVAGVHGYGGCPNAAVRVQGYVLQRWGEWRRK